MPDLLDIQIQNYEGPLDLLIHLIQRNEMNIFDVPISEITEQFISEIKLMQNMDMEIAAEFIHMASYLIYLKSRRMLPKDMDINELSIEEESFNFAQVIIELAFCKDLAIHLKERSEKSGKYLSRKESLLIPKYTDGKQYSSEYTSYQLAEAYFSINTEKIEQKVVINSTKQQVDEIKSHTIKILLNKKETLWSELENIFKENMEKAVAFTSILTMSKHQLIRAIQDANFSDILIQRLRKPDNISEILTLDTEEKTN